jgi:hypothetical protein
VNACFIHFPYCNINKSFLTQFYSDRLSNLHMTCEEKRYFLFLIFTKNIKLMHDEDAMYVRLQSICSTSEIT